MMKSIMTILGLALMMSCHDTPESYGDYKEMNETALTYEEHADIAGVKVGDLSGNASMSGDLDLEPPRAFAPPAPPKASFVQGQPSENGAKAAAHNKAQKIIKSGSVTIDVADLTIAKAELDGKLKSLDGYYESENFNDRAHNLEYRLVIRVPTDGFDKLLSSIDGDFGQIVFKEVNAKDVTEEYVDLGIRLESKLVALATYRQFLKRATNVKEILNVQREIRQIEEEIEAKKGRLRYLDDQTAYSTLRMTLIESRPIIAKAESRHFGQQISNAFISGYDGILNFIIAIAYVWPLWIVLGLAAFMWKRKFRGVSVQHR